MNKLSRWIESGMGAMPECINLCMLYLAIAATIPVAAIGHLLRLVQR